MSIEPGYSGQAFMPEALPRIHGLRQLLPESVHVQVDGGIGAETAQPAREAGANLLVAGTAVFGADDLAAAYRDLAAAVA
jgi:ribulose-phosphate 3-epimerase